MDGSNLGTPGKTQFSGEGTGYVSKRPRRYRCPNCSGEFDNWDIARVNGGKESRCPFCGLVQGEFDPDEQDPVISEKESLIDLRGALARQISEKGRTPSERHRDMDRAEVEAGNDEWSEQDHTWGENFVVWLYTEGIEGHAEVPHMHASFAIEHYVHREESEFSTGDISESFVNIVGKENSVALWKGETAKTRLSLCTNNDNLHSKEWESLRDRVEDALPDDWERQ